MEHKMKKKEMDKKTRDEMLDDKMHKMMHGKGGGGNWMSNKIGKFIHEGKPQKQAVAIAYSMKRKIARRKG